MNNSTRMLGMLIGALALAAGLLGTGVAQAEKEQYLVVAKGNGFSEAFEGAIEAAGGEVVRKLPAVGVAVARSDDPDFLAKASAIPEVQSIGPDLEIAMDHGVAAAALSPVDGSSPWGDTQPDLTPFQWALQAVKADEAQALGVTGSGVRVVVMDGSIMTAHPDLVDNLNVDLSKSFVEGEGVEFVSGGASGNFSHATHVAGIIAAADNGFGTTGVAPRAELVLAKVGRDFTLTVRPSAFIQALLYAVEIDADVVSMSWGVFLVKDQGSHYSWEGWGSTAIMTACVRAANYAHQHGVTLVASAGNARWDGDHDADLYQLPRDLPHVIAVAATGPVGWAVNPVPDLDLPAAYTNYGQSVIDLAAPGGHGDPAHYSYEVELRGITLRCFVFDMVLSTSSRFRTAPEGPYERNGTWTWVRGTSMAAPHVAGVAALVIQANGGGLTPAQIRTILEQSADDLGKPGNDDYYGAGRVNALRAVLQ